MTVSEYILEQSISTATCADIELERSIAKMNVLAEMCRCYEKHEMFTEYASDSSVVTECGIFLEADGATANNEEKKKKTFKEYVKSGWTVLCNLLERFHEWLKKLFDDSMTKILNKIPDGTIIVPKTVETYAVMIRAFNDSNIVYDIYHNFMDAVKSNNVEKIKKFADKSKFDEMINAYRSEYRGNKNVDFTKEAMVDFIDLLKTEKKLQKSSQLMKEIKSITTDNTEFYEGNVSDIKAALKNLTGFMRTNTKYIEMVYTECIKISEREQKILAKQRKISARQQKAHDKAAYDGKNVDTSDLEDDFRTYPGSDGI